MSDGHPRRRELTLATLILAFGVVAWQHWLHTVLTVRVDAGLVEHLPHLLRDALLALPLAALAVVVGSNIAGAIRQEGTSAVWIRAAVVTQLFMVGMLIAVPLHTRIDTALGVAHAGHGNGLVHAVRDALFGQAIALPLAALTFGALSGALRGTKMSPALLATIVAASGVILPTPLNATAAEDEFVDSSGCEIGAPERQYDVSAIGVDITLNQWGDHDPFGRMFVLDDRIADVRAQETTGEVSPGLRDDPIQALVIRANVGDCLTIRFTNQMADMPASFNVQGIPFTVINAPGNVGNNPGSFANFGETITYRYQVPTDPAAEGAYQFNSRYDMRETMGHGLFGMLVVEPAGSTYLHPEIPGQPIESGWEAIIVDPSGVDFREFVIMMHEIGDEEFEGILDSAGEELPEIDPITGVYRPGSRALNYRSEPFINRLALGGLIPDKSLAYSSYAYGDPATPIPRSYLGEPTKTRLAHPGSEMFHVYHLHGGGTRWRRQPGVEPGEFAQGLQKVPTQDATTTRMDSQAAGPGETYTLEHECGAGGCQQAAGDYLFHCHIGEHYVAGMWSFWRVHDTVQSDLAEMPPDVDYAAPPVASSGTSLDLIGQTVEGKTILAAVDVTDTSTEISVEDWATQHLPPQGVTLDDEDATVWDWIIDYVGGDPSQPLVLGEPDDATAWPTYSSPTPGQRNPVTFNLTNGRLSWPTFTPHLAKRPPFAPNGHSGVPWLGEQASATRPDGLCVDPADVPGRRVLYYPITSIDTPIEIQAGQVVPDGMLYVLNETKDAVIAGTAPKEPLVIRANVGDCLRLFFTSEQEDVNHSGYAKTNIHNHFTQFDPQASDGVITGFSYEQSVRPLSTENRTMTGATTPGATQVTVTHTNRLREGIAIGIGLGEGMCDHGTGLPVANPDNDDRACTEIRHITNIAGNVLTLDEPLKYHHAAGEAVGVEFVQYWWYADVEDGTVFFHDHVDFNSWGHGLFGALIVEPAGSTWHDPVTGAEIRNGTIADIHAPPGGSVGAGQSGSFRELFIAVHNEAPLAPPEEGTVSSFNLKSEPLGERDADFPFSSVTNGDPTTPILRAYVGDDVVIRGLGVMEREGVLRVTGHTFRQERFIGEANQYSSITLGISEREDLVLENGAGGTAGLPGDFLIYNSVYTDLIDGAWGLMRVHNTLQGDLQPLPDVAAPPNVPGGFPIQTFTGLPPAQPGPPVDVCPALAPIKTFDVSVFRTLHLPSGGGIMYALDADQADFVAGTKLPEPLVIRVNEGDCLVVNLTNDLNERSGMTLGKLAFDPQTSHGSAIGFNTDSGVSPGATRTYRFYAHAELGTSLFWDQTDPEHQEHGAYGAVVVEPAGATYRDPYTGAPADVGVTADVITPAGSFREQVVLFHDNDGRIGQDDMPYLRDVEGFRGLNYQSDEFWNNALSGRLDINPDMALAFDSSTHGDPHLLLEAYVGEDVRYRIGVGHGEQSHVFGVDGHRFPWEPTVAEASQLPARAILPGGVFDVQLIDGAGGGAPNGADYLVADRRLPFLEAGMWGLLRTHSAFQPGLLPLPDFAGLLRVTTTPALAAQIEVDGIPRDSWSLDWMKISAGSHEVCFQDIAGFTTPPCETVNVVAGATTVVDGAYEQRGFLRVDTSPAVPSTITIDGNPANDWGLWTALPPATYEVCFGDVADMAIATPATGCQNVTITAGATEHITGTFIASPGAPGPTGHGYLRVTTAPAVASQVTLNGNIADTWGLTWVKVAPGTHEICFSDIVGAVTPGCQEVVVDEGLTTVVGGAFSQLGGMRIDTDPAVPATIYVDLVPRDDWGVWTDVPAGTYDVCFGMFDGFAPPCQTINVVPGVTTTVTGNWPP